MKTTLLMAAFLFWAAGGVQARQQSGPPDSQQAARRAAGDKVFTPVNQVVEPVGRQLDLPGLRPQALALSPDGQILATSGKTHDLLIIDPVDWKVKQVAPLPPNSAPAVSEGETPARNLSRDDKSQLSFTGLIFSPDGSRIYLSDVEGSIKVFSVDASHHVQGLRSFSLPPANAPRRTAEIPAGLACSPDGRKLYVALNLGNGLAELDADTGQVLRQWPVGVAPFDVALAGRKIYVSNWGGRRPDAGSVTGPAGRGTKVRVDAAAYIASEGSVTVIDSRSGKVKTEILTGKHASALAVAPDGKHIVAANAASDTLSVIDTKSDQVVETICARQDPGDLFGASPNALAFDTSGKLLFVCNGSQNAVGIIDFKAGNSRLRGLAPVGWYPGALAWDARRHALYAANIKGMRPSQKPDDSFNSHEYYGSLTSLADPAGEQLPAWTKQALGNMRYPLLREAALPPRPGQPPRPVPERVGEPSVFKHVVYIIKENRTYDQVLGDVTNGNGNAQLCAFGQRITPNEHKLVHDFVLLDNTYCCGILSADGHQWADTAMATDYMERSFANFPRSYPDGMDDSGNDALVYSPTGFIWDNCLAHNKTMRDYGEFTINRESWRDPSRRARVRFLDHYHDFISGEQTIVSRPDPSIESLRPFVATHYIGWDLDLPDVQRAAVFNSELGVFEMGGNYPNFVIVCLPNDHTSGTNPNSPTPGAQAADNDLALGRMVDALSHSAFWRETCIFVIEDDPQAGWDHVSAYRTTAYVASPYTKRGATVSTQYNQTSLLRTMELMLGLPPMNQMDATATPMTDCFADQPDFTPYVAVTNNIPLDQMNPGPRKISDRILRKDAYASSRLPLEKADQCPEDTLNRILWHAMKGAHEPYPQWAVPSHIDDD
ncbi:MAG TPA: bifunctional YncE family protein/alkaline phosphatase family protein [Verrucomicrobiae bacterium]